MIIFSAFDGMSCGQIALRELDYTVTKYYASEIDKHAIIQTQYNFPNTIQLGSITDIKAKNLDKIDLFIGGSPCQGFSFAGKQLNFEDPRSALFFEFVRLWNEIKEINPNAKFLLENVNMKKEHLRVISNALGVTPVRINSNKVSAQNRSRWYWTNIKTKEIGLFSEIRSDIPQPKNKGIFLKDILESEVDEKYYLSENVVKNLEIHKQRNEEKGNGFGAVFHTETDKKQCLKIGGKGFDDLVCVAMRGREACLTPKRTEYGKSIRKAYEAGEITEQRKNIQQKEPRTDGKTNTLTSVQKDNLVLLGNLTGGKWDNTHEANTRVYSQEGKMCTLQTMAGGNQHPKTMQHSRIRRLTPTECARLQTIPDWYEWIVSDTQQYKMLGNGWTVDVIKHIFSFLTNF